MSTILVSFGILFAAICIIVSPGFGQATDAAHNRSPRFFLVVSPTAVPVEFSAAPILRRRITATLEQVTLHEALTEIARQAGIRLAYSEATTPLSRPVSLMMQNMTLAAALTEVLFDTGLDVVFSSNGKAELVPRAMVGVKVAQARIHGRVTDARNGVAIAGATVQVEGHPRRAMTGQDGTYQIADVEAGAYVVTARRLGFTPSQQRVTVGAGGEVVANFMMTMVPTALTEVVTTATGERSRLEVGNAIGTIKADSVVTTSLIRNVSDLLTSRTPGVIVNNTTGLVGAPSTIRIRGLSSVNLSNDPIIILDGIRLTPASNFGLATSIGNTNVTNAPGFTATTVRAPSRLDDIDPNMIESIDVLRGPSAASLYGTDAASGVIVIKTKRAAVGPFRLNMLADNGQSWIPGAFPEYWVAYGHLPDGTPVTNCLFAAAGNDNTSVPTVSAGTCVRDSVRSYQAWNDPNLTTLGTGTARNLSTTLSGGTEQLREFLSVRVSDAVGITKLSRAEENRIARMWGVEAPSWMRHPNTEQNLSGSSGTNIHATHDLDLNLNASGIYRTVISDGAGATSQDIFSPPASAPVRGLIDTLVYLPGENMRARRASLAKRGYASVAANYTPLSWLVLRGTAGGDYTLSTADALGRAADCTTLLFPSGCPSGHANTRAETFVTTFDLGAQATWVPQQWLSFRTAVGEQYTRTKYYSLTAQNNSGTNLAFGTDLLTPSPISTATGAQLFSVTENRDESATAGWYVEEMVALRDRLFLTAAFRQDVASAFGRNVNSKAPVYPKFGVSWLVSDESFFPRTNLVSSLRLRAAYGHSGQEARQTAVINQFQILTTRVDGVLLPGMTLSQMGNPDLRPERGAEMEGGFDLSLLANDRIRIEATMYRKLTRDLIGLNNIPRSFGTDAATISSNIGTVENRGWELSTTVKAIDTRAVTWDLTVNATKNTNRLVAFPVGVGNTIGIVTGPGILEMTPIGYPLNSYFGRDVLAYQDVNGDGILALNEIQLRQDVSYWGSNTPQADLTYLSTFGLWSGAVQVNANLNHTIGLMKRQTFVTTTSGATLGIPRAVANPSSLAEQAKALEAMFSRNTWHDKSDVLRVAELSVTWNLPARVGRQIAGTRNAAITFAGRNLALWTNFAGKDPNAESAGANADASDIRIGTIPQPRSWTLRINLGY